MKSQQPETFTQMVRDPETGELTDLYEPDKSATKSVKPEVKPAARQEEKS